MAGVDVAHETLDRQTLTLTPGPNTSLTNPNNFPGGIYTVANGARFESSSRRALRARTWRMPPRTRSRCGRPTISSPAGRSAPASSTRAAASATTPTRARCPATCGGTSPAPTAYYLLGQASLAQQRWDEAARALGKVTALYPGAGYAQRDLGAAYQQLGRTEEATRAYEAALAIRPEDDESRSRMALMLVNAGQAARALPHLTALADRDSTLPDAYLALGRVAYDKNDFAAAAIAFEKAVALRDSGRTWFNLGVVRVRLGSNQAALQAFERAAQYAETKEQAAKEIETIKAGPLRPARSSRPGLPRE